MVVAGRCLLELIDPRKLQHTLQVPCPVGPEKTEEGRRPGQKELQREVRAQRVGRAPMVLTNPFFSRSELNIRPTNVVQQMKKAIAL